MRIGQLADQVGVNPKTIRYYESIGLFPQPPCTTSGYRDYAGSDIDRLVFVRRAQQFELTLNEVGEILALCEHGQRPCGYVLEIAQPRLDDSTVGSRRCSTPAANFTICSSTLTTSPRVTAATASSSTTNRNRRQSADETNRPPR